MSGSSVTPQTVAHQAPLSVGFSRQEYWSGLPRPPPGDLPNPGIQRTSPALQADSLPLSHVESCSIMQGNHVIIFTRTAFVFCDKAECLLQVMVIALGHRRIQQQSVITV